MILEKLEELKIGCRYYDHEPALTMQDLVDIDRVIGVQHCKNLFLCNRQETVFYLLLLEGHKNFRTADVSKQLGVARLSFGSPENLMRLLNTLPGAISPLGLLFDRDREVTLLVDRDLAGQPQLCVHPCVNTASVVLSTADFFGKFLAATGHSPISVDIK